MYSTCLNGLSYNPPLETNEPNSEKVELSALTTPESPSDLQFNGLAEFSLDKIKSGNKPLENVKVNYPSKQVKKSLKDVLLSITTLWHAHLVQ